MIAADIEVFISIIGKGSRIKSDDSLDGLMAVLLAAGLSKDVSDIFSDLFNVSLKFPEHGDGIKPDAFLWHVASDSYLRLKNHKYVCTFRENIVFVFYLHLSSIRGRIPAFLGKIQGRYPIDIFGILKCSRLSGMEMPATHQKPARRYRKVAVF